ncbi:helix-turn-helix domain-containing protein [Arthrospiribacter ruber]|uniref:Helicase n=1 Tax=Arthrospiribacter ruber TaxID=2487934 RepID=A0A951J0S1_9BACT|nr:helix-turn-helix domain-containing protein [Arthrospiribacter ruber]MBW3470533.1 helicase [Arthrospiribacter ruber]
MEQNLTDKLELAARFVNNTNSPIFLTGKAGTGKTTFLRKLSELTYKKFVVVAPTGIAALHAKGVTIHSQFLLPFGSFLPTQEPDGNFGTGASFYTQHTLSRRHPINAARKSVLKSIDLLIIDEVSMLRADVLDAIDFRLKSVKRNFNEPFGGIQVLMIGDLFQLPPIVKDIEWSTLSRFYKSMHFFEAHALHNSGMVYLELDKIFRQKDDTFINILNNLRENRITDSDIKILNSYFKTEEETKKLDEVITITTHNYKAENINKNALSNLPGKSFFYDAEISKDFPESLYPLPKALELKEGAQIMFIKNDTSGYSEFFNGKMAKVKELKADEIIVTFEGRRDGYKLTKEVWENKKYVVNEATKELEEEVVGTFEQYPIKLAWAVTVHKSQGLTFEKAIIDVGQAFAPGQVYVALSRLRTLDGLILRTRISPNGIGNDSNVVNFTKSTINLPQPEVLLKEKQRAYVYRLIQHTFDFKEIKESVEHFQKDSDSSLEFEDEEMRNAVQNIKTSIFAESSYLNSFQNQLFRLLSENNLEMLEERLEKAKSYYTEKLEKILFDIILHSTEVSMLSKTQVYLEKLSDIELSVFKKINQIQKASHIAISVLKNQEVGKLASIDAGVSFKRMELVDKTKKITKENPKFFKTKTGKRKKGAPNIKLQKGETYDITYSMSDKGTSIEEIAIQRGLAESTIRSHLAKGILNGRVSINSHMTGEEVENISNLIRKYDFDLAKIRQELPGVYDYGTLKMVLSHIDYLKKSPSQESLKD